MALLLFVYSCENELLMHLKMFSKKRKDGYLTHNMHA